MEYKGYILDKFQQDAITAIDHNHSVVVSAPTGSGKTLIADYIINKYIGEGIKVIYTAPIKALSNQKYKEFCASFGENAVGLLTGDVQRNPNAQVLIMTTEIYRNMAIVNDSTVDEVSYVVFDEIHYINDIERGYVWEESIIFSKPHVRFLCLSATIPNADEFASWIATIKKHKVEVIHHDQRPVPLHKSFYDSAMGIASLEEIRDIMDIPVMGHGRGRERHVSAKVKPPSHVELIKDIQEQLPCFFFHFSRRGCEEYAAALARERLFPHNPEVTSIIRKRLDGLPPEINKLSSTRTLRGILPFGVGFHHAGLIPVIKEIVEDLFSKGMIRVLYTTETFAVGINMPAKTVCLAALRKFDGMQFRFLSSKEYFQIAGRAGRRGIDKEGFVYAMVDRRDFDYNRLSKLTRADTEPIRSQFKLSVNTVLNLIKMHNPTEIKEILAKSFHTFQSKKDKGRVYKVYENMRQRLVKLGYIKDSALTEKGEFSARIYGDEVITGELFSTDFHTNLTEYEILMIITCLSYEPKEKTEFKIRHSSGEAKRLASRVSQVVRDDRFRYMYKLTAIMHPCYEGKDFLEIIQYTSLQEGDLLRFFRQILDKIGQVRNATMDQELRDKLTTCQGIVLNCLRQVDSI